MSWDRDLFASLQLDVSGTVICVQKSYAQIESKAEQNAHQSNLD
jgi:hypothetical protein